jgi:hypothetical protein
MARKNKLNHRKIIDNKIRAGILNGKDLDQCLEPSEKIIADRDERRNREVVRQEYLRNAQIASFDLRKDEFGGVGAYAKEALKKDGIIHGLTGYHSSELPETTQKWNRSTVQVPNKIKRKKVNGKIGARKSTKKHRCVSLTGFASFVNHACMEHANCIPTSYWKIFKAKKAISKNTQLCVYYADTYWENKKVCIRKGCKN